MKKYLFLQALIFLQITAVFGENGKQNFQEVCKNHIIQAEYNLNRDSTLFFAYLDSASIISEAHNLTDLKCKILVDKGVYYYNRGKYKQAIRFYIQGLETIKYEQDFTTEAQIYDNIGLVNYAMQNYEKAIENSLIALKYNEQSNDEINLIHNHNNLGINYYMLKKFDKALKHYKAAQKMSEKLGDLQGVISALTNIGLVKTEEDNLDGALENYLEALAFCKELKEPLTTSYVLINIGSTYTLLDQPEKSIARLKEAQRLGNENNFLEVKKYCHLYLGDAYAKKGDHEQSFEERRLYDALKDSILTIEKEIEIAEIETTSESEKKQERIESQGEVIADYSRENTWLFIVLFIVILVFGFLGYKFVKNQRRYRREKTYIDRQYKEAEHKNQELKYSLQQISIKLESDRKEESKLIKYKNSSLTSVQREKYVSKILDYMTDKKPYLNSEMTLQEMTIGLGINKHHLSEVLNINFGKNFYSFINLYRVEKAKDILLKDTENLTMLAVAFDSGFNSKSSFNRAFKEVTRITPSQFKEEQSVLA